MGKNKKKNKGPANRNKNAVNASPAGAAPKKAEKKTEPSKPVQASTAAPKSQSKAQPKPSETKAEKGFFSNIVDSIKKMVKQSS
jgi:hypothetical protein